MNSTWNRTPEENRIRRGRRWEALSDIEREAIWADRIKYVLLGAADDLVPNGGGLTVRLAAQSVGLGDFSDLAAEVAFSMTSRGHRRYHANGKWADFNPARTDPDDPVQWSGWKSYVIGRAKRIILPAKLKELRIERAALEVPNIVSMPSTGDARFSAMDVLRSGAPEHFKRLEALKALEASIDRAERKAHGVAGGAGAYTFDEESGEYVYRYPREAVRALIDDFLAEFEFDIFAIVGRWEEAKGRALTQEEMADVVRLASMLERQWTDTGFRTLVFIFGLRPGEEEDLVRRFVCGPGFAGTDSGRRRHRDKVKELIAAGMDPDTAREFYGPCNLCRPPKECQVCGTLFKPHHGNVKKCEACRVRNVA